VCRAGADRAGGAVSGKSNIPSPGSEKLFATRKSNFSVMAVITEKGAYPPNKALFQALAIAAGTLQAYHGGA
jgi:hypothetical protein